MSRTPNAERMFYEGITHVMSLPTISWLFCPAVIFNSKQAQSMSLVEEEVQKTEDYKDQTYHRSSSTNCGSTLRARGDLRQSSVQET